jgi:allantoinase
MIHLCRAYRFRLHIVHLSTHKALADLAAARREGLPVSVETCPHYLHFAAEDIHDGDTLKKCAPPIRGRDNRESLWKALREGTIDLIATDHSPCPPQMKRLETGRFDLAWGGIASLSTALSVVWTGAQQRGFTLNHIVRWMSSAPAELAGLTHRCGALAVGRDANFIVFNPEGNHTVTPDFLFYRHHVSAYMHERLKGVILGTYVRGRAVYQWPFTFTEALGQELTLS